MFKNNLDGLVQKDVFPALNHQYYEAYFDVVLKKTI